MSSASTCPQPLRVLSLVSSLVLSLVNVLSLSLVLSLVNVLSPLSLANVITLPEASKKFPALSSGY